MSWKSTLRNLRHEEQEQEAMAENVSWFASGRKQQPHAHHKPRLEEMELPAEEEPLAEAARSIPEPNMADMPNPEGHALPRSLKVELAARQNIMCELLRFRDHENPLVSMQKAAEDAFNMVMAELKLPGFVSITQESKLDEVLRQQQQLNAKFNDVLEQGKAPAL